jgi:5-methylcytosine-specific restriction endonuclease McrA
VVHHRQCRYCGKTYELTKDNFGHNPQGGFRWKCRSCVRDYVRGYNATNWLRAQERTEIRRDTTFTQSERREYGGKIANRDGGNVCFYCKEPLTFDFHIDHKIPIAKGGTHSLDNLVLACMPCNQEKHAKDIDEYREWRRSRRLSVLF